MGSKQIIERFSKDMRVSQSASGKYVPTFLEWVESYLSLKIVIDNINENDVKLLVAVYKTSIYNIPEPQSKPFSYYMDTMVETNHRDRPHIEEMIARKERLKVVGNNIFYDAATGTFLNMNDPFHQKDLEKKISAIQEFMKKYSIHE